MLGIVKLFDKIPKEMKKLKVISLKKEKTK